MYKESLKRLLREEVESHDSALFSTPHLSKIRHAAAHLLALLEEGSHRAAPEEPCPPTPRNA